MWLASSSSSSFQYSTTEDNVCCGFVVYSFYYVEVCSFYSCFLESFFFFIINGCWILSKAFSASIEIIIWILSFSLLIWWFTSIDLQILKNPCMPGIKPTWFWCVIFLICCWILFLRILAQIHLRGRTLDGRCTPRCSQRWGGRWLSHLHGLVFQAGSRRELKWDLVH